MENFIVKPIGTIQSDADGMRIILEKAYIPAMTHLTGFGYINVLWWFSQSDEAASRAKLTETSPYKGSPEVLGTFATRSPERPNPIALTCAGVTYVDDENGIIGVTFIDAHDGTPVLDIKPYTPSFDRVEAPVVPQWCANWPQSVEDSGDFDWGSVFDF
ncbi:MAG TPA: SAM-dependent methyltransferase [Clostridia bacterium]|nr:SAM-dependent methyltransferase [Clostridia bacterium]